MKIIDNNENIKATNLDQFIDVFVGKESIEKLWKEKLTKETSEGEYSGKYLNEISEKNEHMIMFIFNSIINKKYSDLNVNPKFNYKFLIKFFSKINSNSISYVEAPIIKGIEHFEIIDKKLNLDQEDWRKIIQLKDLKIEQDIIKNKLVSELNILHKKSVEHQQKFINNIIEPVIEVMVDTIDYVNASVLSFTIFDLMLSKKIPKIKDNVIKILIEKGNVNYALNYMFEHDKKNIENNLTYLNYISRENAELIINKLDESQVDVNKLYISYGNNNQIEKELQNKLYKKILKNPEDYLKVYLNGKRGSINWDNKFIDEKVKEVSSLYLKSNVLLEYWIDNSLNKNDKNKLNNEQIKTLINGLSGKNNPSKLIFPDDSVGGIYYQKLSEKKINEDELGYKLLKTIEEKDLFEIKIPYLKNILEKSKETNEYLLNFYLNTSFDKVLGITEDELIKYVSDSKTNVYKENFFKNCFDLNFLNIKKTGNLLKFAIGLIDIANDKDAKNVMKNWFFEIRNSKKQTYNFNNNIISGADIQSIIENKKILNVMGNTVLSSVEKIEKLWNTTIDKENLIKEIDFNKLDYIYEDISEEVYSPRDRLMVKKERYSNVWNELIKQKDKNEKRMFSNDMIENILNSLDIENKNIREKLIDSLFIRVLVNNVVEENCNFLKQLIKEDEKIFENLITKIIKSIIDNGTKTEITEFTKKLLILKTEIDFNENLIMKSYNQSNKKEIEEKLIKKAQVVSLMEEKELNNIDTAYALINKNKNNFYKLGKQIVEFLQLDKDNSETILSKYKEDNLKGVIYYLKRKDKINLQNKINEAIIYNEKQKLEPKLIKEEINKVDLKKLTKEEKEKVSLVLSSLENINKEILKNLLLIENSELKNCMEKTFLGTIKTYSKISNDDKIKNSELADNFNEIMDYCLEQMEKAINKNQIAKLKP